MDDPGNQTSRIAARAPTVYRASENTVPTDGHVAQFYEDDAYLCDEAARYVGAGLAAGEPGLLIATAAHQERIRDRLQKSGFDLDRTAASGQLTWVDAHGTLEAIQRDGLPDWELFENAICPILERIRERNGARRIWIFGDALDLLWRRGELQAAILIEQMWNRLRERHLIAVLCAYTLESFDPQEHAGIRQVCKEHHGVRLPESTAWLKDQTETLVEIRLLQRRARELEREIQRRTELEKALRESQEDLRDYFENALEGLHRVGPDGIVQWANKAQLDLLGYSRDEYIGHHITEFFVDRPVIEACMVQLAGNEELHDQEARLRCKDGSIKHVLVHSNALFREGKFVHSRCFIRDVSARKNLEQDLQSRMAELAEAARRKDYFLAMLGHELRNPLGSISNAVELLRRTRVLNGEDYEQVAGEIRRMTQILDDLLDVSRITHGQIQLRLEQTDVAQLIRSALQTMRPLIEARNHRVSVTTVGDPLQLWGDPLRIEQVLGNLISNAVKYSEPTTSIEVTAEPDGEDIVVAVKDHGIGMTAEFLPQLFEPFTQEHRATDRASGGLGIGLTVAKQLVELHGGRIQAHSDGPGTGTRFVVRLPRGSAAQAAGFQDPTPSTAQTPPTRRHVLIVEDNRNAAVSLGKLIELMGHDVRIAHDGVAALEAARLHPPDVVLLDLGLPMMGGIAVADALKQMASMKDALLVAMTGYGQERDRERTQQSGFHMHLVKPVPADVLEKVLREAPRADDRVC